MTRIALIIFRMFFKVIYYWFNIWLVGIKRVVDYDAGYQLCKRATIDVNSVGRITVDVDGIGNIPNQDGFILFPNHTGLYDPLAIIATCPNTLSIVMKKEAARAPIINAVRKALGVLVIDRKDIRQSMTVINTMTEEVKMGRNYLIFAEGTREKEPNTPATFKAGSFKSAQRAKCPIVPCAIIDGHKAFDCKGVKPVTIKLRYLEPIEYEEYKDMKTNEIADMVKVRIVDTIKRELNANMSKQEEL